MRSSILTALFILAICAHAAEPAKSADSATRQYTLKDLPAFREFFRRDGAIAAKDVEERFGPPTRYAPELIGDQDKDVTPDRSWWVYMLAEDAQVLVEVHKSKVRYVMYYAKGGMEGETLREP